MVTTINLQGKLFGEAVGKYAGLTVLKAREQVVQDLKDKGILLKEDHAYHNSVGYATDGRTIEPPPSPIFS